MGPQSLFAQGLVLRCLRPDVMIGLATDLVIEQLGKQFAESPPFDLKVCYMNASCTTPIVFVLSPGADPMTDLLNMAHSLGMGDKLFAVSLGQGQGPIAENAVN